VFYKYFNDSMPLGISFFTFQMLSYVIDVYKERIEIDRNPIKLIVYLSLFITITSGPIVRYKDIEDKLDSRQTNLISIESGLTRFIVGLFKKVVIADGVAKIADMAFSSNVHTIPLTLSWLGAIAYMLQIYYDFSGYSDMAIGIGTMAGFNIKENFLQPYSSRSVSDFWRRWHISLGSWFRDYIYIPLGGNRVSNTRWIINILIVWGLTGVWHGSSLNYLIWGLYFGLFLILEKKVINSFLEKHNILSHLYTLLIVLGGWIIFRISNVLDIPYYLFSMIDVRSIGTISEIMNSGTIPYLIYMIMGIILLFTKINTYIVDFFKNGSILSKVICLSLFVIAIIYIENSSYTTFLYFRF